MKTPTSQSPTRVALLTPLLLGSFAEAGMITGSVENESTYYWQAEVEIVNHIDTGDMETLVFS